MTKYKTRFTNEMKRQVKLMIKRGKDINKLDCVIKILASGCRLPEKYKDHSLSGNYFGYRECHIEPDWLLVYKIIENELILIAVTTGTHSDLFNL